MDAHFLRMKYQACGVSTWGAQILRQEVSDLPGEHLFGGQGFDSPGGRGVGCHVLLGACPSHTPSGPQPTHWALALQHWGVHYGTAHPKTWPQGVEDALTGVCVIRQCALNWNLLVWIYCILIYSVNLFYTFVYIYIYIVFFQKGFIRILHNCTISFCLLELTQKKDQMNANLWQRALKNKLAAPAWHTRCGRSLAPPSGIPKENWKICIQIHQKRANHIVLWVCDLRFEIQWLVHWFQDRTSVIPWWMPVLSQIQIGTKIPKNEPCKLNKKEVGKLPNACCANLLMRQIGILQTRNVFLEHILSLTTSSRFSVIS